MAFAAAATVSLALGAPLALAALIGGIAGFAAKYLGGFADVAGGGVMGQNIASRLGTAGMIGLSIAEAAWMAAAAWGLSTLMAGFSLAREYVTVSRWGRPGLQTGDWVMLGRKNFLNYILSCKWQPGLGNRFASFASGEEYLQIPAKYVKWPDGLGFDGWIKGFFNQRRYWGPPIYICQ